MGPQTQGLHSMPLTELEKQVILEEAQKAKESRFGRLNLQWSNGILSAVQVIEEVSKDELKARLDPNPVVREIMARGSKVLTKPQTGV